MLFVRLGRAIGGFAVSFRGYPAVSCCFLLPFRGFSVIMAGLMALVMRPNCGRFVQLSIERKSWKSLKVYG